MWSVARRPKWIAAFFLALAVAAAFAALGQWQLERAVSEGVVLEGRESERVVPLASVAQPQSPTGARADGQRVSVSGRFVDGDSVVVSNRFNGGEPGHWIVAHLVTSDGAGLAVALGWSENVEDVQAAFDALPTGVVAFEGRYFGSEGPSGGDVTARELTTVAPAALINLWAEPDPGGVYGGYVVAETAIGGLERIDDSPPPEEIELNLLNIFYAAEWVIFGGFAIFLWWRVVKDEWEREQDAAAEGSGADAAAHDTADVPAATTISEAPDAAN